MSQKKKLKLGDVYCIPLPNGTFAFGRLFKESTLAIFKERTQKKDFTILNTEYECFVGVYTDLLKDGEWSVVCNIPFEDEDEAWAPPRKIRDRISGGYSLYIKGKIVPSDEKTCKSLEPTAVWDRHHIVDRLMGNNIWLDSIQ
jgi:hypothetical protein